jgi:hypothetical protein
MSHRRQLASLQRQVFHQLPNGLLLVVVVAVVARPIQLVLVAVVAQVDTETAYRVRLLVVVHLLNLQ